MVKWFYEKKGYSFITEDAGKDIFAHKKEIKKVFILIDGKGVKFKKGMNAKGVYAFEIELTE